MMAKRTKKSELCQQFLLFHLNRARTQTYSHTHTHTHTHTLCMEPFHGSHADVKLQVNTVEIDEIDEDSVPFSKKRAFPMSQQAQEPYIDFDLNGTEPLLETLGAPVFTLFLARIAACEV